MALRGRMDGVLNGALRGWLWDPDRPTEPLLGQILLDGQPIARFRAELPRADLEAIGFGAGGAGFELPLPAAAQDGKMHELCLVAEDQWLSITADRLALVIPRRLHMLRGRIERMTAGQCRGWVLDQMRPDQPVWVEILEDGRLIGQQLAQQPRADLRQWGMDQGHHGFAINLAALNPRPMPGKRLQLRCSGSSAGAAAVDIIGEWNWMLGEVEMPALPLTPTTAPSALLVQQRPAAVRVSQRDLLAAARKAEGERDHAEAARLLEAGLLEDPENFDLLSIRARIHLAQQEFESAERLARAALRRSPGHPRAVLILARVMTALGRHEEAVAFWASIAAEDRAFRERLIRRSQSLLALARPGEAMAELAQALEARPEDPEIARRMAETAEAAGAPRAALAHWRRLLVLAPQDGLAEERMAALRAQLASPTVEPLPSPLTHPTLREWRGPLAGTAAAGAVGPSPGLTLRALGGQLHHTPVAPRQRRLGELPTYGLQLRAEGGGGEACFALAGEATGDGLRMGMEVTPASPGLVLVLALRRLGPDGAPVHERLLRQIRLAPRQQMLRFDLSLDAAEASALRSAGMELVVRLPGQGACELHPPWPLSHLLSPVESERGFESATLPFAPPRVKELSDPLIELGCPFTSITIMTPPPALAETVNRVLHGTAAPFECILAEAADWPPEITRELRRMAAADPRLRLLPPGAPSATGWVALMEGPPPGGADWLAALHERAMLDGRAEAPGVLLEWCTPAAD
jgi:tetratricopeptide (TPR) repeat protein